MDGKREKVADFLSRLTGKSGEISISSLSSAQKARFLSWAAGEGIELEALGETPRVGTDQIGAAAFRSESLSVPNEGQSLNLHMGVDLQSKTEMFPEPIADLKSDEGLLKIFTLEEIAYAENKLDPYMTLTGIFCAKEAIIKAGGMNGGSLADIEIQVTEDGKPYCGGFELSISHSLDFAIAVVARSSAPPVAAISKKPVESTPVSSGASTIGNQDNRTRTRKWWGWFVPVLGFSLIFALGYFFDELLLSFG